MSIARYQIPQETRLRPAHRSAQPLQLQPGQVQPTQTPKRKTRANKIRNSSWRRSFMNWALTGMPILVITIPVLSEGLLLVSQEVSQFINSPLRLDLPTRMIENSNVVVDPGSAPLNGLVTPHIHPTLPIATTQRLAAQTTDRDVP